MTTGILATIVLSGVTTAGLLNLLGLAMVVTFRSTRVFNLAFGQYMVLGAYLFYWLEITLKVTFGISLVVALAFMALIGSLTYLLFMRPVVGQPLFVPAVITLGLSIVINSVIDIVWGGQNRNITLPSRDRIYHLPSILGGTVTKYGLLTVGASAIVTGCFVVFERRTKTGLQMRAAAEDPLLASVAGIRINRIFVLGWAMGCIAATVGGVFLAASSVLLPSASSFGLAALAPVLLAGFDNVVGLAIGSVLVGLVESFALYELGGSASDAAAFVVLLGLVLVRPTGILKQTPRLHV